jgi:hypothetical protein
MSQKNTYAEIANSFDLWAEFVDPDATITEGEFNAMTTEQKVALQVQAFGPESGDE